MLNTDATFFGGSGMGNAGEVIATATPWHGLPASADLTLPPLGGHLVGTLLAGRRQVVGSASCGGVGVGDDDLLDHYLT